MCKRKRRKRRIGKAECAKERGERKGLEDLGLGVVVVLSSRRL
mgnify:CR=1 FL=1|tara:strand:+ start:58 stop:186 length:129 start_codon:yes stop_codon:yes gene_type:complete